MDRHPDFEKIRNSVPRIMAHELGQHGAKSSFEKNRHGSTQGYAATKTGHTFSTIDLKGGLQNIGGQVQKIIDLE